MRAAPPPPELTSRPSRSQERRLRRRRRRVALYSGFAVVAALVVCAVTVVFFYRTGTEGPPTPRAAADQMLRSMGENSINEFEGSLCEAKRSQAGAILREFNSGLVQYGQTLDGITWRVTKQTPVSRDEVSLDVDVTLVTLEKGTKKRENRPFPMRLQTLQDRGWYVCNIEILTL
ncbi:hypothetical protein [Cryptosporangium phraense]|uniref:Uncharacterized protein n=1 Tax=Cryptosporangium phraense TaxID=2593070 RepID=A0A545AYV0_9ACTN|nr:hypothetical protein [Cryptosporangium phraense]TQS46517.1 hypothetical protein FL583_03800 [Cryptosporangium phraense]